MIVVARRGLSLEFMDSLRIGLLSPVLERVRGDRSLCLELRRDYFNIYYRGGNLMKVSQTDGAYAAMFDPKYFKGSQAPFPKLPTRLRDPADVSHWVSMLPSLKDAMDL